MSKPIELKIKTEARLEFYRQDGGVEIARRTNRLLAVQSESDSLDPDALRLADLMIRHAHSDIRARAACQYCDAHSPTTPCVCCGDPICSRCDQSIVDDRPLCPECAHEVDSLDLEPEEATA